MFRGRSLGRDYVQMLRATHGDEAVVAEKKVVWGDGWVGHMDAFLIDEKLPIEVLSSAAAASQIESKMLQVAGYTVFDPDAGDRARLVLLNPSDYSEERIDFTVDDEWRAQVEDVVQTVRESLKWDVLPERVCRKPTDAIGRFCLHADECFSGWEPEPLTEIEDSELRQLCVSLWQVKETERRQRRELTTTEAERKLLEGSLGELLDPGAYQVGPLKVTRTVVRRPSFNLKKAELEGVPADLLDRYTKVSEYVTTRIERTSEDPLLDTDDFGENVPF